MNSKKISFPLPEKTSRVVSGITLVVMLAKSQRSQIKAAANLIFTRWKGCDDLTPKQKNGNSVSDCPIDWKQKWMHALTNAAKTQYVSDMFQRYTSKTLQVCLSYRQSLRTPKATVSPRCRKSNRPTHRDGGLLALFPGRWRRSWALAGQERCSIKTGALHGRQDCSARTHKNTAVFPGWCG